MVELFKNIIARIKSSFFVFDLASQKKKSKTDFDWQPDRNVFDHDSSDIFNSTTKLRSKARLAGYLFLFVIFSLLWFKLWNLQIVQGEYNSRLAVENRIRNKLQPAPRGLIYDRNGKILASNQPGYALIVYPGDLPEEESKAEQIYSKLKKYIDINKKDWQKIIEQQLYPLEPIALKDNLTQNQSLILRELTSDIKGVNVEDRIKRKYKSDPSLSHLIGYTGKINQSEFDTLGYKDLSLSDYVGKTGLEKEYDEYLRGEKGIKQVEVDSLGRVDRVLAEKGAQVGNSLVLSLDYDLEKKSKEILAKMLRKLKTDKGTVVISDPKTGEILSMVSLPGYDNNIFNSAKLNQQYSKLLNDENRPLFNRVISGLYPSGSVIKPIVAAAALEEEIVGENDWIDCKGQIEVENIYNPEIVYRFKDWSAHGPTNITEAIAESCNVFFYHVSGGFDHIQGLGYQRIAKYFKKFGLGQPTGIDLPLEEDGLIPSPEWKEKTKGEVWYKGDTYHLSIGQGDLLVTPLQVNSYISAIANNGIFAQPHLVKEIRDDNNDLIEKIEPILSNRVVSKKSIHIVRKGMKKTVDEGTAPLLQSLPVSSAAKTGTAQNPQGDDKEHAWFSAFAPYENPQVAITVMIENGGEGSRTALPVANEILNYYFRR
jgi:penicillin-binding protein 2